ncbi:hypothetical protein L416_02650 [Enterobacter hormaechei]|nr:hypothetical protein L416_02650 [Enterobacter hormaechei]
MAKNMMSLVFSVMIVLIHKNFTLKWLYQILIRWRHSCYHFFIQV